MAVQRVRRRPMSEINVVPYIDVMLVLLVIFMITAPLLTQGVSVELPKAGAGAITEDQHEPLVITIDAEGRFYVSVGEDPDQPVDADTLVQRSAAVLRYQPKTLVMVRGDREVDYGTVVTVMALLQQAGAPSVGLITAPLEPAVGR
ncbi:MAG: protein TolR [Gammaproteobacteria bacterium]